jgi:hypothetical protein
MIKYLRQDEINVDKWDQCISHSVNGMIYAFSWYLDIVNNRWEALVEGDYERVMPLTPGKKANINYLFQPPFTQQLGIFSTSHLTSQVVNDFIKAIPSKYKLIEINLNTYNKPDSQTTGFTPWLTHEFDLISDYDTITKNYSNNLKRNLKKARQSKLSISEHVRPEELITIFKENKGKELKHLTNYHYDLLRRLINVMVYKNTASVIGAYDETNSLCAGAFFVFSNRKAIFYFSATNDTAKETGAMPLVIDYFIQKHAHSHITLDFEGSNDPGLARFYKSFGATQITYPHLYLNKLNPLFRFGLSVIKKLKN